MQDSKLSSTSAVVRCCYFYMAIFVTLLPFSAYSESQNAKTEKEIVMVTHPSSADRSLKFQTLRAIYSMRMQTWPDGTPIRVFVLPDNNEINKLFCKEMLKTLPRHLRKNWDRLVFSGIAQAPTTVPDITKMKQTIATTPGAIGYITREDIDDTVAIVNIDY